MASKFLLDLSHTDGIMQQGTVAWATLPTDFDAQEGGHDLSLHWQPHLRAQRRQVFGGNGLLSRRQQFGTPTGGGNLYLFKGARPTTRRQPGPSPSG